MQRNTRIVFGVLAPIPALILAASITCAWAIAQGASEMWRLPFRMMCHGLESRSLLIFGESMPICARCTAIYVGLLVGMLGFLLLPLCRERTIRIASIVALIPLGVDGLTQLAGLRESTNELRIATGLIAGLAFGMWILTAVERRDETMFTSS